MRLTFSATVLAAVCVALALPAQAKEISDYERFKLFTYCAPVDLVVESYPEDADYETLGLSHEEIEVAVRSRLRGARIYSDDNPQHWNFLYVNVNVVESSYSIQLSLQKLLFDRASDQSFPATTWDVGHTGIRVRDKSSILAHVARYMDEFIDEYLRVNEKACAKQ